MEVAHKNPLHATATTTGEGAVMATLRATSACVCVCLCACACAWGGTGASHVPYGCLQELWGDRCRRYHWIQTTKFQWEPKLEHSTTACFIVCASRTLHGRATSCGCAGCRRGFGTKRGCYSDDRHCHAEVCTSLSACVFACLLACLFVGVGACVFVDLLPAACLPVCLSLSDVCQLPLTAL